jgi:Domain of unknown function (DUF5134)
MPGWLGLLLAGAFALVAAHRGAHRDAPGALMALGMAIMATDMAEPTRSAALGAAAPHGPWWAAGFAAIALWPLVGRGRAGQVCGGPVSHLVGGLAMIYMCVPAPLPHGLDPALAASESLLAGSGHAGHGAHHGSPVGLGGIPTAAAPLDGALALAGWALACYFLLATVTALTRRDADGALAVPRLAVLAEAAMAFGTVIMLVAMT